MKRISDKELLEHYITKYEIDSKFQTDMKAYMELYKLERGECICKTGDEMKNFYFHVKGKLKIYTMLDNGKSLLLRFTKPLSILGDVELMSDHKVKCYVDSLDESMLIGIKLEDMHKYAYNDAGFLRFIIQNLSFKLYTISNATSINLLYPLENRLASYLLSISSDENNSRISEIKTTKLTEVATLLGSSYRHLSRIINELEDRGIIENQKRSIRILDFPRLKELAGENIYE